MEILDRLKGLTITRELHNNGYLSDEEILKEVAYNRQAISPLSCVLYRVFLGIPVALLLKKNKNLLPLANRIARKLWINRAIRKGEQLLREHHLLYKRLVLKDKHYFS